MNRSELLKASLRWVQKEEDPRFFETDFQGKRWCLRVNDFPEEPLYTLMGEHGMDFDDKPEAWEMVYADAQLK